jgi:hypothetical protein
MSAFWMLSMIRWLRCGAGRAVPKPTRDRTERRKVARSRARGPKGSWTRQTKWAPLCTLVAATGVFLCVSPPATAQTAPPGSVTLSGAFGTVTINTDHPEITDLEIRNPDGSLPAPEDGEQPVTPWLVNPNPDITGESAVTEAGSGQVYQSSSDSPTQVVVSRNSKGVPIGVVLKGISLIPGVETEDWSLTTADGGAELVWGLTRYWTAAFAGSAGPAIALTMPSYQTGTMWVDPTDLYSPHWDSAPNTEPDVYSADFSQTVTDRNSWLIEKLFTDRHVGSDLRMAVSGGYLTRSDEAFVAPLILGASPDLYGFDAYRGMSQTVTLTLSGVNKYSTGEQLDVQIPDAATQDSLQDLYESVLNGGSVAGQKGYYFGNEVAGNMSGYGSLFDAEAMSVGVQAPGATASAPYTMIQAMRGFLSTLWAGVSPSGFFEFALSGGTGDYQDPELLAVIGTYLYSVYSGNLTLFRDNLPAIRRGLARWIGQIQPNGLMVTDAGEGAYDDAISFGGSSYILYYQDIMYEALRDMAKLERALASETQPASAAAQLTSEAATYDATATSLKNAVNRVLWSPDSPHGPMYTDWIDNDDGSRHYSFQGDGQWPAIAWGIASPTQAREIIQTADARYPTLAADYGYTGMCTPTALWDQVDDGYFAFPYGENGGCLMMETYFEVMARDAAGDPNGAYNRLKLFAEDFEEHSFYGGGDASIGGIPGNASSQTCCDNYLEDMVMTPAALVQGTMGITESWNGISVKPELPVGWRHAQATITYKGRLVCVKIVRGDAGTVVTKHWGRC